MGCVSRCRSPPAPLPCKGGRIFFYTQVWVEHFAWAEDGICILDKTPTGQTTVRALSLDSDFDALEVRSYWVEAGWHPPKD